MIGFDHNLQICRNPYYLPFEYYSLQSEESIRLLRILPGTEADHVEYKLIPEISLNNLQTLSMNFDAPSYSWGKQSPLFEITLDGLAFRIGPNLHVALTVIRYSGTERASDPGQEDAGHLRHRGANRSLAGRRGG